VYEALRAGASGFLLKDASAGELSDAVRVVAQGDALLAPGVTRRLIAEFARMGAPRRPDGRRAEGLTERESEPPDAHGARVSRPGTRPNVRRSGSPRAPPRTPAPRSGCALTAPGRTFLDFDPRSRAVEVVGDLATARRIVVVVPGADTTLATFDSRGTASPGGGAGALYDEARRLSPGAHLAVLAWLG
jgi:hypothetical protein